MNHRWWTPSPPQDGGDSVANFLVGVKAVEYGLSKMLVVIPDAH
jgi:hypothetical protein